MHDILSFHFFLILRNDSKSPRDIHFCPFDYSKTQILLFGNFKLYVYQLKLQRYFFSNTGVHKCKNLLNKKWFSKWIPNTKGQKENKLDQ